MEACSQLIWADAKEGLELKAWGRIPLEVQAQGPLALLKAAIAWGMQERTFKLRWRWHNKMYLYIYVIALISFAGASVLDAGP